MYAYARSAGALDDYHNYLRAIWIDEFLRSRRWRDRDTSVDADLVRRLHRNGTNVQRVQSYASCVRVYRRPYRPLGRTVSARVCMPPLSLLLETVLGTVTSGSARALLFGCVSG